jgi:ubiquinone/menaquinone biosynthesis C-methylase UbiE
MIEVKRRTDALMGRHYQCPTGLIGRIIGERMVRQHEPETLWTLAVLDIAPTDQVLEVGCGAGRAIELVAARVPDGHAIGFDLSRTMVRAATRRNARAVERGRVSVRQGDVAHLPFADRQFDRVLSIHTLYFWVDPVGAVAEIGRVLAPGGRLVLTFSPGMVDAGDDEGVRDVLDRQVLPAMEQAGFSMVSVERGPDSRQYKTVAVVGTT